MSSPLPSAPAAERRPSSSDPGVELVLSVVAGRPRVLPGIDWSDAAGLLVRHGLEGLAVAEHRREAFLPDSVAEVLEPTYVATALHSTLTLEAARRARDALREAGISSLLYKGAALLEDGTYSDPGERRMDDADLLVSPERAGDAIRALEGAAFEPWSPWNPEKVRWLDSACLTDREAPPVSAEVTLDVHWRVRYGAIRFGDVPGPEPLWVDADQETGVPAPGAHLLVLAEHLRKHLRVLTHFPGLGDLTRVAERVQDWRRVAEELSGRDSGRAVPVLLDFAARELGALVPEEVRRAGGGLRSRLVHGVLDPDRLVRSVPADGRLRGLLFRWLLGGSVAGALRETARTVLPGSEWLRARYDEPEGSAIRLRLRFWGDLLRWATDRGVSPVSPNQEFLE